MAIITDDVLLAMRLFLRPTTCIQAKDDHATQTEKSCLLFASTKGFFIIPQNENEVLLSLNFQPRRDYPTTSTSEFNTGADRHFDVLQKAF
jgi:hypothetical protein